MLLFHRKKRQRVCQNESDTTAPKHHGHGAGGDIDAAAVTTNAGTSTQEEPQQGNLSHLNHRAGHTDAVTLDRSRQPLATTKMCSWFLWLNFQVNLAQDQS